MARARAPRRRWRWRWIRAPARSSAIAIRPTFNPNAFSDRQRRRRGATAPSPIPSSPARPSRSSWPPPRSRKAWCAPTDRIYARERRDHGRQRYHPRLEEVRLAHLHRGAPELLQRGLDQGGHSQLGQGALLQVHHRLRLRRSPPAWACPARAAASSARPRRWSGLSLRHHVHRPGDLGDGAADGGRLRRAIANGGPPHAAADRAARCSTAQGREVRGFEPKAVRQVITPETARTLTEHHDQRRGRRDRATRRDPGLRRRGQDGHRAEAGPGDPALLARARRALRSWASRPPTTRGSRMLVLLDEPKNEKWGSEAAAPIFAAIGREALRYLNVPPRGHRARARSCAPDRGPRRRPRRPARRGALVRPSSRRRAGVAEAGSALREPAVMPALSAPLR